MDRTGKEALAGPLRQSETARMGRAMTAGRLRAMFMGILGVGTAVSLSSVAHAQVTDLTTLNGADGFKFDGQAAQDRLGVALSGIGDFNGDGFNDFAASAPYTHGETGSAYVIFGSTNPTTASINLSALDGTNGFRIDGESVKDFAGWALSDAGDVNNDGFADLLVGSYANVHGKYSGAAYIVFGKASFSSNTLELAARTSSDAIKYVGTNVDDFAGTSVSGAGDINGDGFDDMLLGAPGYGNGGAYVIFGKSQFTTHTVELDTLAMPDGFRMENAGGPQTGRSVSRAGDVNADGYADVILAAPYLDATISGDEGGAYIVFGKPDFSADTLDLSALNGSDGIRILGERAENYDGWAVCGGGDINGDGFADVVLGGPYAKTDDSEGGVVWIVFGKRSFREPTLKLSVSDPRVAVRIAEFDGQSGQHLGQKISNSGDFNGDGLSDVLISAPAIWTSILVPTVFMVPGRDSFSTASMTLSNGSFLNAHLFQRAETESWHGYGIAIAQDVNGDGLDDLLIGTPRTDSNGERSGTGHVVFGQPCALGVSQKIKLNFAAPLSDTYSLKATLPVDPIFNPAGQNIDISVGDWSRSVILDSAGRYKADNISVQLKRKGPTAASLSATFSAMHLLGAEDLGLINSTVKNVPLTTFLRIATTDQAYQTFVPQLYTAKQGKSGKTK